MQRFSSAVRPEKHCKPGRLLGAVGFNVLLRGMFRMICSVNMVGVCQVRVMCCFFVVARFVMLGGFAVVARRMLMMFGCLRVMMGCFL